MSKQRGIFEKVPSSGIWWVRYYDAQGRLRREKAGTKSAAIMLYRKRKQEALEGRKLPEKLRRAPVPFRKIAGDALDYSLAHKRPNSYRNDLCQMKTLLEWFGDRAAEAISAQDIEQHLAEQRWAPATANRYRALLSLTYRLAIRNGRVSANPVRFVQRRAENNVRLRFLSTQEEERLRTALEATHPERLLEFELALHTGLRLSEQYGLRWADVDFERRLLTIPRSKNGTMRHVPLNSAAVSALKALLARNGNSGLVCGGVRSPRRWFTSAVRAADLQDFTWHCLRHTFASRLVMAGVDLRSVQELGGWKMLAMVAPYAHLAPGHLRDAVELLARDGTDTRTDTGAMPASSPGSAYVH